MSSWCIKPPWAYRSLFLLLIEGLVQFVGAALAVLVFVGSVLAVLVFVGAAIAI
jgi:hypothetical protein